MTEAKSISIPANPHTISKSTNKQALLHKEILYRGAVGSLMFLAIISRPGIVFAFNCVSRYLNNYEQTYWQVLKRILRYLKETVALKIMHSNSGSFAKFIGYSESDYAGDVDTKR
ncbi:secreted RxLR effector protein 161-like [Belonocnema kinseyi]|uniref:secreted RxLR effector protein 161-like n=1 Tax=Belonocnema kinseyi TaxID=2817044 RepID=UPI00143D39FF|nr:secreted RxLR effector protein 161-like [Belonocnema kinseyi]